MPWHPFEWHFEYVADGVAKQRFVCVALVQRPVPTINFAHLSHVLPTMPNHAYSVGLEDVAMQLRVHCNLIFFFFTPKKETNIKKHQEKSQKFNHMKNVWQQQILPPVQSFPMICRAYIYSSTIKKQNPPAYFPCKCCVEKRLNCMGKRFDSAHSTFKSSFTVCSLDPVTGQRGKKIEFKTMQNNLISHINNSKTHHSQFLCVCVVS